MFTFSGPGLESEAKHIRVVISSLVARVDKDEYTVIGIQERKYLPLPMNKSAKVH